MVVFCFCFFFFFKQKTAYEMRISDWSSDVCSSDLCVALVSGLDGYQFVARYGVCHGGLILYRYAVFLPYWWNAKKPTGEGGLICSCRPTTRLPRCNSSMAVAVMRASSCCPTRACGTL